MPTINVWNVRNSLKLLTVLAVTLMVAFSWIKPIDSAANEKIDSGLKRALISYGTARALNAAISFAQGTEVSVQPMGVGVNLAPGQLLDPINDLVEQFSQLMLFACIAFSIEKILISIGEYWAISFLFTTVAVAWIYTYAQNRAVPQWLSRALLVFILARFAFPVAMVGTGFLTHEFLLSDYQSSQSSIEAVSTDLGKNDVAVSEEDNTAESVPQNKPSFLGRLFGKKDAPSEATAVQESANNDGVTKQTVDSQAEQPSKKSNFFDKFNPKKRIKTLLQSAEKSIEHMIKLMVVFVLETVILPIGIIWIFFSIAKGSIFSIGENRNRLAERPSTK